MGTLLSQLDKRGIRVILPMRNSAKRLKEMEAIDVSQFRRRFEGRRLADVFTYLKDYPNPLRFLVLKVREGGESKYVGFITNDLNMTSKALLNLAACGGTFLTGLTRLTRFFYFLYILNILSILSKKWDFLYYQDIPKKMEDRESLLGM